MSAQPPWGFHGVLLSRHPGESTGTAVTFTLVTPAVLTAALGQALIPTPVASATATARLLALATARQL